MVPLPFRDRIHAAGLLAQALRPVAGTNPLVLAIPRGAVPMARVLADQLHGDLDVILVRKLGAPGNPEFAIGAIDELGQVTLSAYVERSGADEDYVAHEAQRQLAQIRERRARYRPGREPLPLAGRTVIVVDDGLATGSTMAAALAAARAQGPKRLICAVPVAAADGLERMRFLADDVVCLATPWPFHAVGQFYQDFRGVEDDEVIALLAEDGARRPRAATTTAVSIPVGGLRLDGDLVVPPAARGLVVFAHGSGSSRRSPRNRQVAHHLEERGLATLLFDLLTPEEDIDRNQRFEISLLAHRLDAAVSWASTEDRCARLPIGLFGASTGAAAALIVAARRPKIVAAVVSRGGRPDLVPYDDLASVRVPTRLIVGSADTEVLALNRAAAAALGMAADLQLVPGATHLFEEPGALEHVAALAAEWFLRWLSPEQRAQVRTERR